MSKFALLALFLMIILHWASQPFEISHTDDMLEKYRPSLQKNIKVPPTKPDSIYAMETNMNRKASAIYALQAKETISTNH